MKREQKINYLQKQRRLNNRKYNFFGPIMLSRILLINKHAKRNVRDWKVCHVKLVT